LKLAADTAAAQSRDMQASIKVAADAAKAAAKSAEVAENAIIAADRAWISIKAEIIENLKFEKERIVIGVGFDMTNVGKSPATHVDIWAEFCPDIMAAKEQGQKAAKIGGSLLDFGVVLFGGDVEERNWRDMEFPAADFKKIISDAKIRRKEDGDAEAEFHTTWPAIMACATYRLAGSSKTHHTVILFEVRSNEKGHLGWDGTECTQSLATLKLVQTFMSGQVT
jgi:hypothetical protein